MSLQLSDVEFFYFLYASYKIPNKQVRNCDKPENQVY